MVRVRRRGRRSSSIVVWARAVRCGRRLRRRTARGWRTTRWTIDRSGTRTGGRCWTEPARTRERAPVSAATEYDAAFRNDAGGYFLPADASSPAFGRKRSRAVSKIIRCVRNSRARLSSRWPRSSSRPACPRRLGQASRSLRSISKGPSFGTGRRPVQKHKRNPAMQPFALAS